MKKAGKVKKSKKREVIASDIETTETKVEKPEKKHKSKKDKVKSEKKEKREKKDRNEWGHAIGTQSAMIDEMLQKGSDLKSIAEKIGSSRGRVRAHVNHLMSEKHGVQVKEKDGVWKIAK